MQNLRQLGGGVIIAIFSIILVIGGVFLSLAEALPAPATPTQVPPTLPLSLPSPTSTTASIQTPTETVSPTSTATQATSSPTEMASLFPTTISSPPASCTPPSGWIRVITSTGDSIYSLAQRYKTTADSLSTANCLTSAEVPAGLALYVPPVPTVTVISCGPPAGWVRAHVVQRGDTLFRIALSYGISYTQLQRANCMGSSTTIYAGQRLWVPNLPPRTPTPGVTVIPNFPTETPTATPTTIPPTNTPTPTDSPTPTATQTQTSSPTPTSTPTTPAPQ